MKRTIYKGGAVVLEDEPAPTPERAASLERMEKLREIARLESQVTPRRLREAMIDKGGASAKAFVSDIDAQISAIRATLT